MTRTLLALALLFGVVPSARPQGTAAALSAPAADSTPARLSAADRVRLVEAFRLARAVTVDQVRLGEDITQGQQIEQFVVDAWDGGGWQSVARGTTIGYSRIVVLDPPVTTTGLRVQVLEARSTHRLSLVGAYRSVPPG